MNYNFFYKMKREWIVFGLVLFIVVLFYFSFQNKNGGLIHQLEDHCNVSIQLVDKVKGQMAEHFHLGGELISIKHRKPLHVYLTEGTENAFEVHFWLHTLIGGIRRPIVLKKYGDPLVSDSLVMGRSLRFLPSQIQDSKAINVGIFHWADEGGTEGALEAVYPYVDYVLRNYYFHSMFFNNDLKDRIVWIPNGYRTGFGPLSPVSLVKASERSMLCNFIGSAFMNFGGLRTDSRSQMIRALKAMGNPCYVEYTEGFGGQLNPISFGGYLRDSTFTLCPWGNSKETIRLYESMEAGSIPIMLPDAEFFEILDGHPFVTVESWSSLPELFDYFKTYPSKLDEKQVEMMTWWKNFKANKSIQIEHVISNSFRFHYQCHDC